MLHIPKINVQCGDGKRNAQRKKGLDQQNNGNQQNRRLDRNAENQKSGNQNHQTEQIIDGSPRNGGNRQHFAGKIYFFHHVSVSDDDIDAVLYGRLKKNPRQNRHEQKHGIIFDIRPQDIAEHERIHDQHEKGVQKCPQKAEYRTLVSRPQIGQNQTGQHLTIQVQFLQP
jgi:hypothetical protein